VLGLAAETESAALVYESNLSEEQARQYGAPEERSTPATDISDKLVARQRVERLLECLDERDRMMLILKEVEGLRWKRLRTFWS